MNAVERQITHGPGGRILTNVNVWSPDSHWIVYDTRSDAAGEKFDGARIEMANVESGEVVVLYESRHGARCGVATFHPIEPRVAFILGPENPTPDWQYAANHRQGVMVDVRSPGRAENLDACDLVPPFTPGALRGGSHVHVWDASGQWVSFTYNDALVEPDIRDAAISVWGKPVRVPRIHPRNHDGSASSFVVTRTTACPKPGSDEIKRACEEGWVGINGYMRPDGTRQRRALAFQGHVVTANGETISEVFIADLPDELSVADEQRLSGTATSRPIPPGAVTQRRLTFTAERQHPGLQGPRHWLRSSPDGSRIAFLLRDDAGVVQLWTVSPNPNWDPRLQTGSTLVQVTRNAHSIASAFTWNPEGTHIAHIMDHSVCVTNVRTGETVRLTKACEASNSPRPEACVFSPDGEQIAFIRRLQSGGEEHNQVCVVRLR